VIVLVLAGGATGGYLFLAHWRPSLEPGERYGIDVSNHQGVIDWDAVAGDGISFAYAKATEGRDWVDKRFAANWAGAADAGIDRGAYHFFSLCTDGAEQAEHFLRVAKPDPQALAPALDLEGLDGDCAPSQATVAGEVAEFVALVEDAWDREMVLYVLADWEDAYPVQLDRQRWHRGFVFRPDFGWHIWQLHGFADVDGVDTRVDINVMRP
jgi:lysozyme